MRAVDSASNDGTGNAELEPHAREALARGPQLGDDVETQNLGDAYA
jgi:hypothetical protein